MRSKLATAYGPLAMLACLSLLASACNKSSGGGGGGGPVPLSITTSNLPDAVEGSPYSFNLAASGGFLPYMWSLDSGSIPGGLSLDAAGLISGTPTVNGPFPLVVRVTDSFSPVATTTASLTLTVQPALAVTTTSLPDGAEGTPYFFSLAASGGIPPYSWTLSGGTFPTGLTLSAAGDIIGTPSSSGTFTVTVQVTDGQSPPVPATAPLSILVTPALIVTTASLPDALEGVSYSFSLAAAGGTLPYTWSITGTLPAGLTLFANGNITGTPTTVGLSSFTVEVMDSLAAQATRILDLNVLTFVTITTTSLPPVTEGTPYSETLMASGGLPPYSWTLTGGSLPGNLLLATNGAITGTPGTVGRFPFDVQVADTQGPPSTSNASLSIVVFNDPTASTPPSITLCTLVGTQRGLVDLCYTATDAESDYALITAEFSTDSGLTYAPATTGPSGEGSGPVEASPTGVNHLFVWDSFADIGAVLLTTMRLRLTPSDSEIGLAVETPDFTVDNQAGRSRFIVAMPMQTARMLHTMTMLPDGTVLIAGGTTTSQVILASAEIFSPVTGEIVQLPNMTTPRTRHTATLLPDGTVLIAGGIASILSVELDTGEIYDPASEMFQATGNSMRRARVDHASVASPGGAYVTGGNDVSLSTLHRDADFYDPASGMFTPVPGTFATARAGHTAHYLPNDRILLVGGSDALDRSAEEFDPITGTSPVNVILAGWLDTLGHRSSLLANGMVLVSGGGPGWGIASIQQSFDQAELYTSPTGFTIAGPMSFHKREHTSTEIPDGRVLLAGGQEEQPTLGPVADSDLYDPSTLGFSNTASMTTARQFHAAVLLQDGRVLITGGRSTLGGDPVADTERFHP
ncbi:MAG: putative Ig domain-containing protein [Planctomycetota bacterium]|nr:putative Ig domain-containing protein [Planctomycetota bacterium]